MRRALILAMLLLMGTSVALAQDPVEVDEEHYKVVFENDQVRVLRITYEPGDKSVMHKHPAGVAVFLSDQEIRFHLPDGDSDDDTRKAGEAIWADATEHQPENIGDEALELILVEMKSGSKRGP